MTVQVWFISITLSISNTKSDKEAPLTNFQFKAVVVVDEAGSVTFKAIHVSLGKREEGIEGILVKPLITDHSKVYTHRVLSVSAYLFVPLITALNDSSCQFLLLPKWTTLQDGGRGG